MQVTDHIQAGYSALEHADWAAAQRFFQAALDLQAAPEAHDGLGLAFWWLNDITAAHHHRTQAFLGYQQAGNLRRAAWIAAWLAREQVFLRANVSAMNGWFARAERLLDEIGPCVERGWFDLYRASMTASPASLADVTRSVIAQARAAGDTGLEVLALANAGFAEVGQGQIGRGMRCIDEAMAVATSGQVRDIFTVCETFCVTLSTCELACDWVRTDQWCAVAAEYAARHNSPFLSAYCRTTYGGVLLTTGRWQAAEQVLSEAISTFDAGHRALRVHAVLKLADLRVCQGRLEEAAVLLAGYEDYGNAAIPRARLHLARGEALLARSVLDQALQSLPPSALQRAPLQRLIVDVCLALGDTAAAQQACDELAAWAYRINSSLLLAEADLALGQLKRVGGDPDALHCFAAALERLQALEQSLLAGRARLEMARTLLSADRPGAIIWARAALACFTRIGAGYDADAARQVLRAAGAAVVAVEQSQVVLTRREQDVLGLLAHGLTNREIAARLVISEKTAEHHVGQILSKLGVRSRAEAAAFAIKNPAALENS